jgi:5-deoxy-glucuronate isomerase
VRLHHPRGTLATDERTPIELTPSDAGWTYCGLTVFDLVAGEARDVELVGREGVVLPLSAEGLTVTVDGEPFDVRGRSSVFSRVTDFVYAPLGATITVMSPGGGEVAIATARCERRLVARYGRAEDVSVEVRGAGPATRQVTNFMSPEAWPDADRLMCVELLTPDGNWSSYPPHRHDDSPECPVNNEEIYYFRIGSTEHVGTEPAGFGLHRTYTPDGDIDEHVAVRDGDVFCVPRGFHGPCVAAPGYPMYYLNVLAGPGGERSMAFCDDPAHHWVRDTWVGAPLDPRCPMTNAAGARSAGT